MKTAELNKEAAEAAGIGKSYSWKCVVCGEIVKGENPPAVCPVCGVGPEQFVRMEETDTGFSSAKKETFLIIGNGAAGTAACDEIRKRNKVATIEMISRESAIGYNRPMLTKGILSELDIQAFYIKPESWYRENNIRLTLGTTVTGIDAEAREINLSDGSLRSYDKLILATGAQPAVPNMEGANLDGVFSIRTLSDVKKVQEYLRNVEKVVVIGGGILGLEAAWEIKKAGKDVTVVQRSRELMNKQLDQKGSTLLREAVEKAGVAFSGGIGPKAIEGSGAVTRVRLLDDSVLEAQMVIFSTGIKANLDLAVSAGIETDRYVVVNDRMETNLPGIYACGDCAICNGKSYGIWSQAVDMGKVAGANAAGDQLSYEQTIPSNTFVGMGTSLFSIGDTGADPSKNYENIEVYDTEKETYEKYYFAGNRFCGGILMGDITKAPRLLEAYRNQEPAEAFR